MNERSEMPFGKYKGRKLKDVPAKHLLDLYHDDMLSKHFELEEFIVNTVFELEDRAEAEFRNKKLNNEIKNS